MQRIVCSELLAAQQDIQELMDNGWHIVPDTMGMSSMQVAVNELYPGAKTPNWTAFEPYLWATLERDSEE